MAVVSIRHRLNYDVDDDGMVIPFVTKQCALDQLNTISRTIREIARSNLKLVSYRRQ